MPRKAAVVFSTTSFYFLSKVVGDRPELLGEYGGDYLSFVVVGFALIKIGHWVAGRAPRRAGQPRRATA